MDRVKSFRLIFEGQVTFLVVSFPVMIVSFTETPRIVLSRNRDFPKDP